MQKTLDKIGVFLTSKIMHSVILSLVLVNAVVLGMLAQPESFVGYMPLVEIVNEVVLTLLALSVSLRVIVFRSHFFEYGWNTFDLVVVSAAILGYSTDIGILKVLRVLMVFRIIVFFPTMRLLVEALLYSFRGILSSILILAIIFYAFSIAGFYLFQYAPGDSFTSLGTSFANLFQLMLFDDFGSITRPIVEAQPWAWGFFIIFLFSTAFSFVNLLIGIFVEAINRVHQEHEAEVCREKKALKK